MTKKSGLRLALLAPGLLVTLLGLPLVTPLFRWTVSACTHDGHLHYHRIAAIYHAWQDGLFFSRWMPDLAFGYGYPFFLYREAPPLYLALIPHALGLPLPAAINLFYILCILAAGWFMYLWVRDIFGPLSGIIAAAAYMAAPYQLIDAIIRGNQPESLALPLLPFLLWIGRRFIIQGSAVSFLAAVFGFLFLALSHNISLFIFTPLFFIYLALTAWFNRLGLKTAAARLLLIFGLGLGLSAFYVGPALLELDEITISQSVNNRNNDFRFNFVTLDEIFAPVHTADPSLLNQPLLLRLGWVPSLLAVVGVGRYLLTQRRKGPKDWGAEAQRDEQRGHVFMMVGAAAGLLLMALGVSQLLWEHIPLIEFIQFPWRFVGRAALPLAFLAGVAFAASKEPHPTTAPPPRLRTAILRHSARVILAAAALIFLLLEALPYLYPHYCLDEPFPTIQTVHNYEHNTGLVGVDPAGSYFPVTVQERPQASALEADYLAGRPPQRFDATQLPEGASITTSDYPPLSADITLTTPEPFQARYLTFAFPGWTALVDGREVEITPTEPEGLIAFPVPAGQHTIEVRWQATAVRQLMTAISLLSLVGVAITAVRLRVRQDAILSTQFAKPVVSAAEPLRYKPLLLTAVLLLVLKLLIIDNIESPIRQASGPTVENPAVLRANELQFAGYNLDQPSVPAGESFTIDLAWETLSQPPLDYQSNVWLVGPDGNTWSDKETHRPRVYESTAPTTFWVAGQWAWDSREVPVLPGTPPGRYDIVLTLFNLADLQPVTLLEADGRVHGPTAVIGTITVTRPDQPPVFQPQIPLERDMAGLYLLGYNQDRLEAAPGEQMLLTFFWEKNNEQTDGAESLELSLLDGGGQPVQSWEIPPVRTDYPPTAWEQGERLRGQHVLRLAAGLESGRYQFRLEEIDLETITINAPDRLFSPPEFETAVNAIFGNQIELVGYTTETIDGSLSITLIWQGLAEMPVSYRVFIHLVGESGQIITQSDGEPANWGRPTTGWADGEYIVDTHQLTLLTGTLPPSATLRVGLYDPVANTRLLTGTADFLLLFPNNQQIHSH